MGGKQRLHCFTTTDYESVTVLSASCRMSCDGKYHSWRDLNDKETDNWKSYKVTADIIYQVEKYCFTEISETVRLNRQWANVLQMCRDQRAVPEERVRLALLNVDYVTSFELPFRLLLL